MKKGNFYSSNCAGGDWKRHRDPFVAIKRADKIGHFGEYGMIDSNTDDFEKLELAIEEYEYHCNKD